jgi:triacylglycerol lipase
MPIQIPRQIIPGRAPLWNEALAPLEYRRLRRDPILAGEGVKDGNGRPVLVLPGFLASDLPMHTMVDWLRRTGHRALYARAGTNIWCGEETMTRLQPRLEALAERHGRQVVVIGHSRGGHFARVLAARCPDLVAGVATLGTPALDLGVVHPLLRLPAQGLSLASRLVMPRAFGSACFTGACCERFRTDLAAPLAPHVQLLSVVCARDGFADRGTCAPDGGEVVVVDASHAGAIVNPETYRALADFIAQLPARTRPRARRAQASQLAA